MATHPPCPKSTSLLGLLPTEYVCFRFPPIDNPIWPALCLGTALFWVIIRRHSLLIRTPPAKELALENGSNLQPQVMEETMESRAAVRLPPDVLIKIFGLHMHSVLTQDPKTIRTYRTHGKKLPLAIAPLAWCSKEFYELTLAGWRSMWASCGRESCPVHAGPSEARLLSPGVHIITAEGECLASGTDLSPYLKLIIASINYHNYWLWDRQTQDYRLLPSIVAFPTSLTQLEILHMHAPEREVIALVSDCCPRLVELRLVRCTMFNDPSCLWWRQRTHEHDYMQDHTTTENVLQYANSMVFELRNLPKLEVVHLGHYMTNIQVVFTHRTEHLRYHPSKDVISAYDSMGLHSPLHSLAIQAATGGPPIDLHETPLAEREFWAAPCPICERELVYPIEAAERLAASVLAQLESLRLVSFASFLSEKRIRPSHWWVRREINQDTTTRPHWKEVDRVLTASYDDGTRLRVTVSRMKGGGGLQLGRSCIFGKDDGMWRLLEQA